MKNINYNVELEIIDNLPKIEIVITYEDEFTNDHYLLKSEATHNGGTKEIPFVIIKNGETKGKLLLSKRDINSLLSDFLAETDDLDLEQEFLKNDFSQKITNEINEFLKRYDEIVITPELTMEGEVERMKKMAGIK